MNRTLKKMLRTMQVGFPFAEDLKFELVRFIRNVLRVPFEADFNALSLFPDLDGKLFLDIGANRGYATDSMLMKCKRCHIHQFEPNHVLYSRLKNRYGRRDTITIHNCALGEKSEVRTLFVPQYKKWLFDGLASFKREEAAEWLRDEIFFYSDRHLALLEMECNIKSLDEFNLDPAFMKLDVQGFELNVLKGGERTIRDSEPILLIESPDQMVIDYLQDLEYTAYSYHTGKFTMGTGKGVNTFFMPQERSSFLKENSMSD